MRFRLSLALLFVALSAASATAQYTYIVPVNGTAQGFRSAYYSEDRVVNPNATAATLRYEAIYPVAGAAPCVLPSVRVVPPRSVLGLAWPCNALHAMVVTSDQPIRFMVDILSIVSNAPPGTGIQYLPIEVATEWLAPETDALIPTIRLFPLQGKANLVLVNPNDFLLTVKVHVDRPELKEFADSTIQVPPRSLLMSAVAQIPNPPPNGFPQIFDAVHNVTVRANGKFQAGVSNTFDGSTIYRGAISLQP